VDTIGWVILRRPDLHQTRWACAPWATRFPSNALARHARNWTGSEYRRRCEYERDMSMGRRAAGRPLRGEGRCRRMLLLSTTVNFIRAKVAGLWTREDGVTAVEYALMVAIIALLMVAGFFLLFNNVSGAFTETGDCVADAANAGSAGCPNNAPAAP
jgi:Flp pilus assembly pilin Flp